jgi:hypothetical protein
MSSGSADRSSGGKPPPADPAHAPGADPAYGLGVDTAPAPAFPGVGERIGRAVEELDATITRRHHPGGSAPRSTPCSRAAPTTTPSPGCGPRVLCEIGAAAVPLGFQPSVRFAGAGRWAGRWAGRCAGRRAGRAQPGGRAPRSALQRLPARPRLAPRASRLDVVVDATVTLQDSVPGVRLTVTDDGVGISGRRAAQPAAESRPPGGGAGRGEPVRTRQRRCLAQVVQEAPLST